MKFPYARFASGLLVLGAVLGLGACSRSQHLDALTAPGRVGSGRQAGAGCPTLVGNDINTAFNHILESGSVVQFRPGKRLRMQMQGDAAEVSILAAGPCAATDIPSINFIGGHANVFLHGTGQSITTTGQRLTFGPLTFIGEAGIVLASDAQGNVLEIIWPELAGIGVGSPIIRVELAQWNAGIVDGNSSVDCAWDMTAEQDGVRSSFKGSCEGMGTNGSIVTGSGGGASIAPCPATLAGASGDMVLLSADCVQFRSRRARFEAQGDLASGVMNATGICASSDAPTIRFTGGTGNVFQGGGSTSVTATGKVLAFGPLLQVPGEAGIVLTTDAAGNVLEIIWPTIAGLPPGPPIVRLQLAQWSTWIRSGRKVDFKATLNAVDAQGHTAAFNVVAKGIVMPVQK